ncbi:hypothetical protein HHI36_016649 [Cryptolaemus montrouzieri]|uniref:Uncharacterized protein n=1 Tax=Cryptolaemus montrouzieri TaxID=559131 RepID=A0ABD2NKE2_9CUCU
MMRRDCDKLTKSVQQAGYVKEILASAVPIEIWNAMNNFIIQLYIVLISRRTNTEVRKAKNSLKEYCLNKTSFLDYNSFDKEELMRCDDKSSEVLLGQSSSTFTSFNFWSLFD